MKFWQGYQKIYLKFMIQSFWRISACEWTSHVRTAHPHGYFHHPTEAPKQLNYWFPPIPWFPRRVSFGNTTWSSTVKFWGSQQENDGSPGKRQNKSNTKKLPKILSIVFRSSPREDRTWGGKRNSNLSTAVLLTPKGNSRSYTHNISTIYKHHVHMFYLYMYIHIDIFYIHIYIYADIEMGQKLIITPGSK